MKMKKDRSEYFKKYREKNKENLSDKRKIYLEKNEELIKEGKKKYYENNKNYVLEKNRENYTKNIEKYRITKRNYVKNRMDRDSLFKLKFNTRSLVRNAFKRKFTTKSKKTTDILGCSFEEFKLYIEKMFNENMNWNNYGEYWELDHIKPIFLSNTEEEILESKHYTNFQPLYWKDNLKKSDNFKTI